MCARADGSHLAKVATRRHFPGPTRSRALPTPTAVAVASPPLLLSPSSLSLHTLIIAPHALPPASFFGAPTQPSALDALDAIPWSALPFVRMCLGIT